MADKRYTTNEVAERAGVSRDTLLRWLKAGKVPEPDRDRNGWRIFSDDDVKEVLRYKNLVVPGPNKSQSKLFK